MTSNAELVATIEEVGEAYARFVEGLSEDQFHRRPDPNEWSAAEITGHLSELVLWFANQARRLAVEGGGRSGREADDPARLVAVERLTGRGPALGAYLLRIGVRETCRILRSIPEEGWNVTSQHPRRGQITVRAVVEGAILEELEGHLRQAKVATGGD